MESLNNILNNKYHNIDYKLENDFNNSYENNSTFKKVVDNLGLPHKELMKYTTKLEDTSKELDHCKKCPNILKCSNTVTGYVYYPSIENELLVFSYVPCKYKKQLDKQNEYKNNIYTFDIPREIKEASMKEIDTDDPRRFEVIECLKNFIDDYKKGIKKKGLYLTGNFGCGKTYLVSAMLNELAKSNHQVAIIYYPDFLRMIKESFNSDSDYKDLINIAQKVELLLIDDIGAETTTPWARDEVLGTILQYRMQEHLTTFFTSNLTLKELEDHLSVSSKGVEKVKARRIIERIKQLTEEITMISANKRK
jgi:primosomal protein DnaI